MEDLYIFVGGGVFFMRKKHVCSCTGKKTRGGSERF